MLTELAKKSSVERVEAAVRKAISACDFFPTKEQIEQRIPEDVNTRSRVVCGLCSESEGWLRVTVHKHGRDYNAVQRCSHAGERTFTEDKMLRDYEVPQELR